MNKIQDLFLKLNLHKADNVPKFGYYIDMGGEFYVYEGDSEDPDKFLYEENIHQFIHELMEHFNVRDDT